MKKMKSRSSNFFIPQRHLDVVSLLRDGVLWRDAAVLCSLQGEDQAGVLHVQPHVWRNGEEEPDEAGGGLLRAGGFLVHQTDQVRPDFTFPPCCHLLAARTGLVIASPASSSLPSLFGQARVQHAGDLGHRGSPKRG